MCQAMSLDPSLTGGETIDLAGVASMSVIEGVAIGPDAGSMTAYGEHREKGAAHLSTWRTCLPLMSVEAAVSGRRM